MADDEPIKYPLPCGCAGTKYLSMCLAHQEADRQRLARLMGIRSDAVPHCPTCACKPKSLAKGPAA